MINDLCNDCNRMQRMRYPEALKQEALRLLAEHGVAEASRQTGIPAGTIASWGSRLGVKAPSVEQIAVLNAATAELWQKRKLAMGERLGAVAEKMLQRIDERINDDRTAGVRDLAASMAVLIDRAQLLTGGATTRAEVVERTPEAEAEVAKVLELVRTNAA